MVTKGSCSCGCASYKIEGNLQDAASCHCSMCRKASGSSASSFAVFKSGGFSWLSGEEQLSHYKSSEDMGTYFCSVCGSPLAGTYRGQIGWVALGCVDGDPGLKVEKHIFMGSKAPWETGPNEALQYDEFPGG